MAESDSEIVFNRQHNNTEMEDQPGTDTEELDKQQEHDGHDRAASVLSSIDIDQNWKTPLNKSHNQDLLWREST